LRRSRGAGRGRRWGIAAANREAQNTRRPDKLITGPVSGECQVIANALLTASTIVFLFALADVFLSESQKSRIEIVVAQLWSKLDDYKSHSLWPMFRSFYFKGMVFVNTSGCGCDVTA
jgi:hypothetical protein